MDISSLGNMSGVLNSAQNSSAASSASSLSSSLKGLSKDSSEDELKGVVLSEDPGYVKEPLVAIQAEDGTGNWINGLIDQNSRVIALDFRILDDQSAVNVKLKLAEAH